MTVETQTTGDVPNTSGAASTAEAGATGAAEDTSATKGDADASQQTSDPAAAGKTAEKGSEEAAAPAKVVPEKYEFTAPEGTQLDTDLLGEFEGIARELELTQEDAQKVVNLGPKLMQKLEARQAEFLQTASAEWASASASDKEFGGDKLDESMAIAKGARDAYGTPELNKMLEGTKLGNHPEVIRFFYKVGLATRPEGTLVQGGKAIKEQSAAQRMYPNMNP